MAWVVRGFYGWAGGGGGAADEGTGLPSAGTGSMSSTRVPSGSKRLSWRLPFLPRCGSRGLAYVLKAGRDWSAMTAAARSGTSRATWSLLP